MRTTLDIPKDLIDEAMKVTGAPTKSQVIREALQARIDQEKRKKMIAHKGTIDLDVDVDVDLDTLRERS